MPVVNTIATCIFRSSIHLQNGSLEVGSERLCTFWGRYPLPVVIGKSTRMLEREQPALAV